MYGYYDTAEDTIIVGFKPNEAELIRRYLGKYPHLGMDDRGEVELEDLWIVLANVLDDYVWSDAVCSSCGTTIPFGIASKCSYCDVP